MPKVLVIDNYDSFVYNLVQYFGELGAETLVIRNDAYPKDKVAEIIQREIKPSHILISPGPGKPKDSGISIDIITQLAGKIPIFGVCLGMQAMGEIYGATVTYAPELMHGKVSEIVHSSQHPIFKGIPNKFTATRYHSLVVDKESLHNAPDLVIEAQTSGDGLVMALSHRKYPSLVAVQYHPESILSQYGHKLLGNFLSIN